MTDAFYPALWREPQVVLGVADTTAACRMAQSMHTLRGSAAVALGRLLTCTALLRFVSPRVGTMSLQVLCSGPLRHLFADVNDAGHLRGYCKGPGEIIAARGRIPVAASVGGGMLSVLRAQSQQQFNRSATELHTGEIDADVQHFAEHSEQIPTVLVCDVLLDSAGQVHSAAGFIAQGLPGAAAPALQGLRDVVGGVGWASLIAAQPGNPAHWLRQIAPQATAQAVQPLHWQCRCSLERALVALRMLPADELREMVSQAETAKIDCEFCGTAYEVAPEQLAGLVLS